MSGLSRTKAHRAARNAASIALADTGPGASSIQLFTTQGGTRLAVRHLAKPCGTVRPADGRIALTMGDTPDIVEAQGGATYAAWCDADGVEISGGRVTDPDGNYTDAAGDLVADPLGVGPFVLGGTAGTVVYLGGLVLLYTGLIG